MALHLRSYGLLERERCVSISGRKEEKMLGEQSMRCMLVSFLCGKPRERLMRSWIKKMVVDAMQCSEEKSMWGTEEERDGYWPFIRTRVSLMIMSYCEVCCEYYLYFIQGSDFLHDHSKQHWPLILHTLTIPEGCVMFWPSHWRFSKRSLLLHRGI